MNKCVDLPEPSAPLRHSSQSTRPRPLVPQCRLATAHNRGAELITAPLALVFPRLLTSLRDSSVSRGYWVASDSITTRRQHYQQLQEVENTGRLSPVSHSD
ncbi:hypothetical protein PoB_002248600 [Plakobranchus ocellatus]|uniref:Uncharacterized protein n=1 Tax=Plakobranchus ocellatus TaxID=259542 RepID=A0AAV3ZN79_9GAST|nr:hypothetical protein PoB_002248600 [Plakobranchus ocellatus]